MKAVNTNDKRVLATEQKIKEAFTYAFTSHDYNVEEVTITEICRMAGIHRTTFYKHYDNTKQLYEAVKKDAINKFKCSISKLTAVKDEEYYAELIDLFKEYVFNVSCSGFNVIDAEIGRTIEEFSKEVFFQRYTIPDSEYTKNLNMTDVYNLITGGFMYATMVALREDPSIDSMVLSKRIVELGKAACMGFVVAKE